MRSKCTAYFLEEPAGWSDASGVLVPDGSELPAGGARAFSLAAIAAAASRLLRTLSSDNILPEVGRPAAEGGGTDVNGANGL